MDYCLGHIRCAAWRVLILLCLLKTSVCIRAKNQWQAFWSFADFMKKGAAGWLPLCGI